jgi:hypothetical protein
MAPSRPRQAESLYLLRQSGLLHIRFTGFLVLLLAELVYGTPVQAGRP